MAAADPIEESLNEIRQIMELDLDIMMGRVRLQQEIENYLYYFDNINQAIDRFEKYIEKSALNRELLEPALQEIREQGEYYYDFEIEPIILDEDDENEVEQVQGGSFTNKRKRRKIHNKKCSCCKKKRKNIKKASRKQVGGRRKSKNVKRKSIKKNKNKKKNKRQRSRKHKK